VLASNGVYQDVRSIVSVRRHTQNEETMSLFSNINDYYNVRKQCIPQQLTVERVN
jgi:hypothetical protein